MKCGKIYFSENQISDFIKLGLKHLPKAIWAYKKVARKDIMDVVGNKIVGISDNIITNKVVNKFFNQV